ncbi:hypothetical protein [Frankia sp. R82]|uniref:hypothetical protein n=1 Tax=Frankia sp. R82 TaxID=2950553 RepID=UPI0020434FCE|nr:hypothetical protein [Frankia sp. R82]MCM3886119.1 hypothetical protein [Frankia sp. R82]
MTITDADRAVLAEQTTANVTGRIRAAQQRADARRVHFTARRAARTYGNTQRHRTKLARLTPTDGQSGRAPPGPGEQTDINQITKEHAMGMTLKQAGDHVRRELGKAQEAGTLPADIRLSVRASNSKKNGPVINVTIDGYETHADRLVGDRDQWHSSTHAADLLAAVETVRAGSFTSPTPGQTRYGALCLSATPTTSRVVTSAGA